MRQWHDLLSNVLNHGNDRPDRTGVGTRSLFGLSFRVENTGHSFPAVTTKRLAFQQVLAELACFIHGYQNLADFHANGCTIWDGNGEDPKWVLRARCEGDLGRIYGVQWRDWTATKRWPGGEVTRHSLDQLKDLIQGIKDDPHGRRHLVTAWNPGELDQMCLPPCHVMFQCYVEGRHLHLAVTMRSVDLFIGLPFDIASYAVLQRLIAQEVGLQSGELVFFLGDAHVYQNHFSQVNEVLSRTPFEPPTLFLGENNDLFRFTPKPARLSNYHFHPAVLAPLNV